MTTPLEVKESQRPEIRTQVDKENQRIRDNYGSSLGESTITSIARANVAKTIRIHRLRDQRAEAIKRASTDPLTGLLNQEGFNQIMVVEAIKARKRNKPMAVVFLDLNGLKQINDTQGHDAGNRLIQSVAEVLIKTTRSSDVAVRPAEEQSTSEDGNGARWGGDEFGLILFDSDVAGVAEWWVQRAFPEFERRGISISAGAVVLNPEDMGRYKSIKDTMQAGLEKADSAMYRAKQFGDQSMNQIRITTF